MRDVTVLVDGETVDVARGISALDRGFLLGDGAFEVLRTYGRHPFRLRAHLDRLYASLDVLRFASRPERSALEDDIARAIAEGPEDAYVRVVVTRGDGLGLVPRATTSPRRVVLVAPMTPPASATYEAGVGAEVLASPFDAGALRSGGAKASSYVESVLATLEAREGGATEAIYMAPSGQILEGASSNVFAVVDGVLRTPRASAGILAGITRAVVLDEAAADGLAAAESLVTLPELARASEIFLTSSIRELVPVTRLDGRPVGAGVPGPVYLRLRARYAAAVARSRGRN